MWGLKWKNLPYIQPSKSKEILNVKDSDFIDFHKQENIMMVGLPLSN